MIRLSADTRWALRCHLSNRCRLDVDAGRDFSRQAFAGQPRQVDLRRTSDVFSRYMLSLAMIFEDESSPLAQPPLPPAGSSSFPPQVLEPTTDSRFHAAIISIIVAGLRSMGDSPHSPMSSPMPAARVYTLPLPATRADATRWAPTSRRVSTSALLPQVGLRA